MIFKLYDIPSPNKHFIVICMSNYAYNSHVYRYDFQIFTISILHTDTQ